MKRGESKEGTCGAMNLSHAIEAFANRGWIVFACSAFFTNAFHARTTATSLALLALVLMPLDESVKNIAITSVEQGADRRAVMCLCAVLGVLLTLAILPTVSQIETILRSSSASSGVTP